MNTTWLCAIIFPLLMLLLMGNALVFDATAYKSLLRPGAVQPTMQLLDYFQAKGEVPDIFNANEKAHLADVKQVISLLRWVSFALLIVFLALLTKADAGRVFITGFWILLAIIILIGIIPFDTVFTQFHKLFFSGNWLFPPDSMLIMLYPEAFFQAFFAYIASITAVFSGVPALFGYILHHRKA